MQQRSSTTRTGGFSPAGRRPTDAERAATGYAILREIYPDLPPLTEEAAGAPIFSAPRRKGGPHRHSQAEARWRPIAKQLWGRLMSLVEEFERHSRLPGRQGALKQSGVTLYRGMLFGFLNPRSGQCDPSYEALAERCGLSRASIHKGLARLEAFGLIERVRRWVPRPIILNGRRVGTTYEQTSNGYRLGPPRRISLLLDVPPKAAELWDQWVKSWQTMLDDMAELLKGSESTFTTESTPLNIIRAAEASASPLDAALSRLRQAIGRCSEGDPYGVASGAAP